jgi:hypothetical protein
MPWKEEPKLPTKTIVEVTGNQYAPIPNSAIVLLGPGKLEITRHPSGAVNGRVLEGNTGTLDTAVWAHRERVGW